MKHEYDKTPVESSFQAGRRPARKLVTIKHGIYRYKFRDNIQRMPTNREALLFSVLDIEKIILIRQHSGLDYSFIEKVNNKIKARVGM